MLTNGVSLHLTQLISQSGITCVLLEGSMTITARDNAIKRFHEDSDCRVFLISLKAGGVALNLTVASHVSKLYESVIVACSSKMLILFSIVCIRLVCHLFT